MKTLIELYDERAIENVLGAETFKPEKVIYLCPTEIFLDGKKQKTLINFFHSRGIDVEVDFIETSMYKADKIYRLLTKIASKHDDCVIDITGGTDAALFAAGMFCQSTGTPAFTYSRKNNSFYEISRATFADRLPCTLKYSVEDFINMTGGYLKQGRVDNRILHRYMDKFVPFFGIYLKYKRKWSDEITYLQRISQPKKDMPVNLEVYGKYDQKGERGSRVYANPSLLHDLQNIGFIKDLNIIPNKSVYFVFKDENIRSWLRDVGSVLELYMYKICVDTGIFDDIVSSAVVNWDDATSHDTVSNEIDVVASRGVIPLFISCKTCEIKTEALNELAILKDRFGGKGAKAVLVTTEHCNAAARHRAAQLGMTIIDIEELSPEKAIERIKIIMKVKK
jgi:hypothetical protein